MYALADNGFAWRVWAGDAVIYDAESGDTHRVKNPGGLVLQSLAATGSISLDELADACALSSTTDFRQFEAAIDVLVDLGILNRS